MDSIDALKIAPKAWADYSRTYHVLFTPTQCAIVNTDLDGNAVRRLVWDFPSKSVYLFNKTDHNSDFYRYNMSDFSSPYQHQFARPRNMIEYIETYPDTPIVTVAGLPCKLVKSMSRRYATEWCATTTEIELPGHGEFNQEIKSSLDTTVILKLSIETETGPREIAVDSISRTILHPEWLSIDTSGLLNTLDQIESSYHTAIQDWFLNTDHKGLYLDKAYDLYTKGLIEGYKMAQFTESNLNTDPLALVRIVIDNNPTLSWASKLTILHETGLIQEQPFKELTQFLETSELASDPDLAKKAFLLAVLADGFRDPKIRKNIVDNLFRIGFQSKPGQLTTMDSFLTGDSTLSEVYYSLEHIYSPSQYYTSAQIEDLEVSTLQLLKKLLPGPDSLLKVDMGFTNSVLTIEINDEQDTIRFIHPDYYPGYGWDELDSDSISNPPTVFSFDESFVSGLLPIFKQYAIDKGRPTIHGFKAFAEDILEMDYPSYVKLVGFNPDWALFSGTHYFFILDSDHWLIEQRDYQVPVYLPLHQYSSLTMQSGLWGPLFGTWLVEYIPTRKKKALLDFLKLHQEEFSYHDEELKALEISLLENLIPADHDILQYIPQLGIEIIRSSPSSKLWFTGEPIPLEIAFPRLSRFFKGYLKVTNLRSLEEGTLLQWENPDGTISTIPLHGATIEESILQYVAKHPPTLEKDIYILPNLMMTSKMYYYFSKAQKKKLEEILNVKFILLSGHLK